MSDVTRAGRHKLWFDVQSSVPADALDGDVLVLNDDLYERVSDATGGAASPCFQCGVCTATCPWGQVRSEPIVVRHLVRQAQLGVPGWTDALWLCTTCGQCSALCPRGVDVPRVIQGLRNIAWQEKKLPEGFPTMLWNVYWDGNPYGRPPSERSRWMSDMDLHEFDAETDEILLYLGCTANYDRRIQKVARALVQVLNAAGVKFGVLKDSEPCCGDAARGAGHIQYADEIAAAGSELFRERGARTVVAISPHCLDQFVNHFEMPEGFRPLHYTEYLHELIDAGRLNITGNLPLKVAFHDPCYLGRRSGDFDTPREVLASVEGIELREMRHNRDEAMCCGGGGGRMWLETPPGERFADLRVAEAAEAGAEVIGTACPHCVSCLEDSSAGGSIKVADVAELLSWALSAKEATVGSGAAK